MPGHSSPSLFSGKIPRPVARLAATARAFARARQGAAAVEFAICGLALLLFIFGIVNLGLLGMSLSALARGVQSAARAAAVYASAQYANEGTFTCPSDSTIVTEFNNATGPALPGAGDANGSNPRLTITWTNNGTSSNAGDPPGLYLTLTGTYRWSPIGFNRVFPSIPLRITTVTTVMGSQNQTTACASS
jgi:Flp pilus assembly protein TadG